MDGCFGYHELKALEELINPTKNDSDSEDDLPQAGARKLGKSWKSFQGVIAFSHTCSIFDVCIQ